MLIIKKTIIRIIEKKFVTLNIVQNGTKIDCILNEIIKRKDILNGKYVAKAAQCLAIRV